MTRVFGYSLPCTCLVPFGDLFNHGNSSGTHYIVNRLFEMREELSHEQYKIKGKHLDLSIVVGAKEEAVEEEAATVAASGPSKFEFRSKRLGFVRKNWSSVPERLREKFGDLNNCDVYIEEKLLREMTFAINAVSLEKDNTTNIWDLTYFTTSATEDNDTDEDQTDRRQKEYLKLYESEQQSIERNWKRTKVARRNGGGELHRGLDEDQKMKQEVYNRPSTVFELIKQRQENKVEENDKTDQQSSSSEGFEEHVAADDEWSEGEEEEEKETDVSEQQQKASVNK